MWWSLKNCNSAILQTFCPSFVFIFVSGYFDIYFDCFLSILSVPCPYLSITLLLWTVCPCYFDPDPIFAWRVRSILILYKPKILQIVCISFFASVITMFSKRTVINHDVLFSYFNHTTDFLVITSFI